MSNSIKLGDIVQFSLGKNITRMKVADDDIYTLDDFDCDLTTRDIKMIDKNENSSSDSVSRGDCILSLTRSQAVIVSSKSIGKYISSNFVKCSFDNNIMHPWFFCYLINEDVEIAKQIKRKQQTSNGFVSKLNINSIADIVVSIPELKIQSKIGMIYKEVMIQEKLRKEQIENWKKLNFELLKKMKDM